MAKKIVFCADGTWDGTTNDTNVYILYKALLTSPTQLPLYDDGLGADGTPIQRLTGGAFGTGIFQKVKDAYTSIAHAYDPGDEIFIFGFSRGAYTARSLAGFIAVAGLPTETFDASFVDLAFQAYRQKDPAARTALLAQLAAAKPFDAKLTLVGVWDTVGALGIPAIIGDVDPLVYGFLDTGLHPDVLNACQALAVDERRLEFQATLWTGTPAPGQVIDQVWFSGVHCDVGGSYPETGLSDITLSWMMGKAQPLGLEFDPGVWSRYAVLDATPALDTLHESWSVLWGLPKSRTIAADAALANSVAIRCEQDGTYRPKNLILDNGVPAAGYAIRPVVAPAP